MIVTAISDDDNYETSIKARILSVVQELDTQTIVPNAVSFALIDGVPNQKNDQPIHVAGIVGFALACIVMVVSFITYLKLSLVGQAPLIEEVDEDGEKDDVTNADSADDESRGRRKVAFQLSHSDEEDQEQAYDFLNDAKESMTWGRRVALRYKDKQWYNPQSKAGQSKMELMREHGVTGVEKRPPKVTKYEIPSIEKAWAYFEHSTLPVSIGDNRRQWLDLQFYF